MKNIRHITLLLPALLMAAMLAMYGCDDPKNVTPVDPGTKDPTEEKSAACDLTLIKIERQRNSGMPQDINFSVSASTRTATAIFVKWIDRAEPDYLVPTFTHTGEKVLVNGQEVTSATTPVSFAEDVAMTVVAENGSKKTYTIKLICPQINTELPVLRLQPDRTIDSKDVYVNTWLEMYSPRITTGGWSRSKGQIEVRGRGNSTWGDTDKKPYRLKFPDKISPLGLNHANDRNWVILANDSDKSFMRNEMAFAISRVLFNQNEGYHDPKAVMFTPCSQFVNVYMNSDYIGIYQMSDHMQRDPGRIAVEKLTAADGDDPVLKTGGYILETDIHGNNGPDRFNSAMRNIQINRKYPDSDDFHQSQYNYIREFVNSMENALYSSDFKDKTNGWRKYMDEKTAADFLILKELAGDADGYTSTYCYKRRGVDKLFFGPGWDFDKGWNNEWRVDGSNPLQNLMLDVGFGMPGCNGTHWFKRLWEDESFRAVVQARWASKRSELVAAALKVLDEKPAAMPMSVKANFSVWSWWNYAYPEGSRDDEARRVWGAKEPAPTYDLEIERLRTWTNNRASALDRLLK